MTTLCPVCETPNEPDSTHCVVCGERLTPPEPGEEIAPEENVSAMLDNVDEAADSVVEPVPDLDELQAAADAQNEEADASELESEPSDTPAERPMFLYSPMDGTAYPQGSAEYEDGFGPMGEQLVADPPGETPSLDENTAAGDGDQDAVAIETDDGGLDHGEESDPYATPDDLEHHVAASDSIEPSGAAPGEVYASSAQFQAMFEIREKDRQPVEPLPQPSTYDYAATVTVYANREPVFEHAIDTDETLIGRRDPVSDAYPEIDLSDVDTEGHVSRKHAYIYRQNKNYTIYVVSNSGTQVNSDLLQLGDRRRLESGDVIVLAGAIAMKFEIPAQ